MDVWRIPCRSELGWYSTMSIESAVKCVDARCLHYTIGEVVSGVYYTLGKGLIASAVLLSITCRILGCICPIVHVKDLEHLQNIGSISSEL